MTRVGRRTAVLVIAACVIGSLSAGAQAAKDQRSGGHAQNVAFQDLRWQKMVAELGDRSPEIAILRVDPNTQATQLMIRVPNNTHVPKHWHSANETHTVLSGTFLIECEGTRAELGPNSFNYVPSRMAHEAWTKPAEGALLFITLDGAWDINWVGGPPKPEDFTPKTNR